MAERKANTMELSGNDYAKVAERLRLFREDWPKGKQESAYEVDVDGSLVFTVWLWKDKSDLMDLIKSGVLDKDVLRSSADANGNAKGDIKASNKKDFEKLETIALGRALANLGYLASGEIASSEEMEEFEKFRDKQQQQQVDEAIERIKSAQDNDALNEVIKSISHVLKFPAVVEAGKAKRAELIENQPEKPQEPAKPSGGKKIAPAAEKPADEPKTAPALPLEDASADS